VFVCVPQSPQDSYIAKGGLMGGLMGGTTGGDYWGGLLGGLLRTEDRAEESSREQRDNRGKCHSYKCFVSRKQSARLSTNLQT
jgi:hypothetical protein